MIIDFNRYNGGGGSGSGVTPQDVQRQIDSALTPYWDSAVTESAITLSVSGKADAANVSGRSTGYYFPYYNAQGVITGDTQAYKETLTIHLSDGSTSSTNLFKDNNYGIPGIYVASKPGTAGQIAKSDGHGFTWADDIYTPTSGFSTINGSAITNGGNIEIQGGADAKILVDFDRTPQADRATLYTTLKTLYDGGSGDTINKTYDFYKTVGTKQGLKIDYYTFSADTMIFGKVASPDNTTEQVVYAQVLTIDSGGNVSVVTNTVGGGGGGDMSGYWNSAQTKTYVDSAVTSVQDQVDTLDEVVSQALVDLNDRVDEISGATQNMVTSTDIKHIVKCTQAEYDDPSFIWDPETLYIIVNNSN